MTHFTDPELQRWRDAGAGADRERIVAHVAECAACAASYAEAIRLRPLESEAPTDVRDFVKAGYAVARPKTARWTWAVPLAAAAGILVVALVLPRWVNRDTSPSTMTFRGGGIHALAPSGTIEPGSVVFTWSSAMAAPKFRIEVGDAGGLLFSVETAESRIEANAWILRKLQPGGEFWWTVAALDAEGKAVAKSPRQVFTIRRR